MIARFLVFVQLLLLVSCAGKSWVIRHDEEGGVIGYSGYSSSEDASEAVKNLIHCSQYQMVSDQLNSLQSTGYIPLPTSETLSGSLTDNYGRTTNYQSTVDSTRYAPIPIDKSYRTFTYRCLTRSVTSVPAVNSNHLFFNSQSKSFKQGKVNVQKVLMECRDGQAAFQKLKKHFDMVQAKLNISGNRIKNLQSEIDKGEKSPQQIEKMKEDLEELKDKQKIEVEYHQSKLQEMDAKLKTPILAVIKDAVDEFGLSQDYYIIQETKEEIGLSNEVIMLVDQKSARGK